MRFAIGSAVFLLASIAVADVGKSFKDDFSSGKPAERKAMRGDWKFDGGVATCKQDDELYKKFKDHGPIIFYDVPLHDGTIRFSYKAEAAKTVVFTGNGEKGHIFRFVTNEKGTSVRAFPGEKSISLGEGPALKQCEWIDVIVNWKGPQASIQIGKDYKKTFEHTSYNAPKTNISIGFSYGTLSIKGVSIEPTSK